MDVAFQCKLYIKIVLNRDEERRAWIIYNRLVLHNCAQVLPFRGWLQQRCKVACNLHSRLVHKM